MQRQRHQIQPSTPPTTADGLRRLQLALEAQIAAAGASGVSTFNARSGDVSLVENDIFLALGYIPEEPTQGYLPISIIDLPTADPAEPLLRLLLPEAMTFTAEGASADVAATSPSALRIRKNGAANGTITFTGATGVISFTNASYAANDIFELYPPTAIDATLDRVSITLGAT